VQQPVRSSPVSAIVRSLNVLVSTLVLVSALVQVTPNFCFSLVAPHITLVHPASHPQHVHFFCPVASTPHRVLRHLCTCIARPLCIDGATSCRVSCFARQLRGRVVPWPSHPPLLVSFPFCAVRRPLVHLEHHLALLIRASRQTPYRSPSHSLLKRRLASVVPPP
jgi:hypothetical protein